jgi:tetratricopeptide (TPR) repeat protein
VPIDRAATLRNAEKLIRQGKLPDAIAEYVRLVEDQPGDWNLQNSLGDLYARAGDLDRAITHYSQIADSLNDEGAGAKAAAVYKKILKLKPDHEHTLVQVSEILGTQGRKATRAASYRQGSVSDRSIRKTTKDVSAPRAPASRWATRPAPSAT